MVPRSRCWLVSFAPCAFRLNTSTARVHEIADEVFTHTISICGKFAVSFGPAPLSRGRRMGYQQATAAPPTTLVNCRRFNSITCRRGAPQADRETAGGPHLTP
jgi:hypothetical protein